MGLMEPSGSDDLYSKQDVLTTKVTNANDDVMTNRTSLDITRYKSITSSLTKYYEGTPISVDYYKRSVPFIEKSSGETTFSLDRSDIEVDYTKIIKMEMKLKDELSTEYDDESSETSITGIALLYPGIDPNVGDVFLFSIANAMIGVFLVNNIKRLSIFKDSHFEIEFHMYSFLNEDIQEKLNTNTSDILYFDKQKYLTNDITLLKSTSFLHLKALKQYKDKITRLYFSNTFNKALSTITYTEGDNTIVDPFMLEFVNNITSIKDCKYHVKQLVGFIVDDLYKSTILNGIYKQDRFVVNNNYVAFGKINFSIWDSFITEIVDKLLPIPINTLDETNKMFIFHDILPPENYIFSTDFYTSLTETDEHLLDVEYMETTYNLTPIEYTILRHFVSDLQIDIDTFISDFLDKYPFTEMTSKEFFYQIPFYLFIINILIFDIT